MLNHDVRIRVCTFLTFFPTVFASIRYRYTRFLYLPVSDRNFLWIIQLQTYLYPTLAWRELFSSAYLFLSIIYLPKSPKLLPSIPITKFQTRYHQRRRREKSEEVSHGKRNMEATARKQMECCIKI